MKDEKKNEYRNYVLIGLGGTGTDIVNSIFAKIPEVIRNDVVIHGFDTNENDISDRVHLKDRITKTSVPMTPGQYIDYLEEKGIADEVLKWFPKRPVMWKKKSMADGAGQIRSTSRLAFRASFENERKTSEIRESIRNLTTSSSAGGAKSFEVYIVSSIVGGTGSGMFIQIALYLKDFIFQEFGIKPKIKGAFLLPGIFTHTVIPPGEYVQVRGNAYAAIKELDNITEACFFTEQRNRRPIALEYSPDQVKSVHDNDYFITSEKTFYPYDLVFLFDDQSYNGLTLPDITAYKNQVINTVYNSIFTGMSKRLNGDEDNLITESTEKKNKNFYCSVGVGQLIYPYEDTIRYLATRWAESKASGEWLKIDRQFEEEVEEYERSLDLDAPKPEKKQRFVEIFENEVESRKPLSRNLVKIGKMLKEKAVERNEDLSLEKQFLDSVIDLLKETRDSKNADIVRRVNDAIAGLDEDREDESLPGNFEAVFSILHYFKNNAKGFADKHKRFLYKAVILPEDDEHIAAAAQKYHINTYIVDKNLQGALHPLAIRYFLIKTVWEIDGELESLRNSRKTSAEMLQGIEDKLDTFFDFEEADIDEPGDAAEWARKKKFFLLSHKEKYIDKLVEDAETVRDSIGEYVLLSLKEEVLGMIRDGIDTFIRKWEDFFTGFERVERDLRDGVQELEKKNSTSDNPSVKYLLASRKHKQAMWNEIEKRSEIMDEMPRDIFLSIYEGMYGDFIETISSLDRTASQVDVEKIFTENVIDFNMRRLENMPELDLNLHDALKEHCRVLLQTESRLPSSEEIRMHMRKLVGELDSNVSEWLQHTANRDSYKKYWGCNPASEEIKDFIPDDATSVQRDETFSKHELIRLKGVYGIKTEEMTRFAYSKGENQKGQYFEAYMRKIRQIEEEEERSFEDKTAMTPHLDKMWHYAGMMRDINPDYDERQRKEIRQAFLYGIMYELFYRKNRRGIWMWHYDTRELKSVEGNPVVDINGLFDALFFLPHIVDDILMEAKEQRMWDKNKTENLREHTLIRRLFNPKDMEESVVDVVLGLIMEDFESVGGEYQKLDEDLKALLPQLLEILREYIQYIEGMQKKEDAEYIVQADYLPEIKQSSVYWREIEKDKQKSGVIKKILEEIWSRE